MSPERVTISVRLAADLHRLAAQEAALQGVGLSQYIREALVARALFDRGLREPAGDEWDDVVAELRRLVRRAQRRSQG